MKFPLLIGLTGGIGSGKSSVAKILEAEGFPVYYSDIEAKNIVNKKEIKTKIIALLGENAYDNLGKYNTKWIAEKVFQDENLLSQLNAIIHPAVKQDFEDWLKKQNSPLVFKETALLFELGLEKKCYKSILITAEENIRIKRVMNRDGKTYREVKAIIDRQMPEKEKISRADFVIENNQELDNLQEKVKQVLKEIKIIQ
ncbi:MAG: dephospho-CoA kinase [Flavobacteriaceae bacterium]|nr:dephospho-CoA kinase [Flavobacteriaceae bacterium]